MKKSESEAKIREAVVRLLAEKGYSVRDTSSGSGVPKLSRLEIANGRENLRCAVKITTDSGRISFTRNPDGTYKVLSEVDRVIYARPFAHDPTQVAVSFFGGATVKAAFEENFTARKATGQDHLPIWLSPELEPQPRFIGSGFRDKALWSEDIPLVGPIAAPNTTEKKMVDEVADEASASSGFMEQIKATVAERMGVRPDQLEIDVRMKI